MHNEIGRRTALAIGLALTGALALPGARSAPLAAPPPPTFHAIGAAREFARVPQVYQRHFVARRGPSPFDRVGLHRIAAGPAAPTHPEIVLLYLPGTNMNGEVAIDDARYSMPLYLAAHGVDIWTMDYRTHFVPADARAEELRAMLGWTSTVFEQDIAAAAAFVCATTHNQRLFVAGFSRGAGFAYLFAADHSREVAGLVILDGFIARRSGASMPAGRVADDIGGRRLTYGKRRSLLEAVIRNPGGPAPLPQYKTAAENLAAVVYHADGVFGGHGGLANPQGGFSEPSVLARLLLSYDRWWPAVQDYENPFEPGVRARLAASKIPVLAFASTNISATWPAKIAGSAAATGSNDVTVKRLNGWGHLDVICGSHAENAVYAPTLAWLRRHQM